MLKASFFKNLISGLMFIFFLSSTTFGQDWSGFQADVRHSGESCVDFLSKDIASLWTFKPTEHIWSYKQGSSVWSSSAAIARVKDKTLVFVGFYNHNLYALDAADGRLLWKFIAGGRLNSAPFFAEINSRPTVFVVSSDRTIYCLDAANGEKFWSYETLKWSYTVSESVASSPIVVSIDDKPIVIFSIWNSDCAPLNFLQRGEVYCLDAASGNKIYSTFLSSSPLNSPAFSYIDGHPMIYVSSTDGRAFGLDARDGKILWEVTLCAGIHSTPSVGVVKNKEVVFLGSRFGNLYCLDAANGAVIWSKKFGYFIDSTPAIAKVNDKTFLYFGAYDRNVYCLDAETGKTIWKFKTGDYVAASCAIAKIKGAPVVFVHSLDNNLYCLDALDGSLFWKKDTGRLIWKYQTRGDTNWSSPAVSSFQGKPLLVFPSYDGNLYAFSATSGTKTVEVLAETSYKESSEKVFLYDYAD